MFIGEGKSANVSWCGEMVLRDPPLSSVQVLGVRAVLKSCGWPVTHCSLEVQTKNGLAVSLLETCLTSVCDSAAFVAVL